MVEIKFRTKTDSRIDEHIRIKYEAIKVILIMKIMEKYKSNKFWLKFYSEFELDEDIVCSLYFFNMKTKREIIYEITNKPVKFHKYKEFMDRGYEIINIILGDLPDSLKEIEDKIGDLI